MTTGFVQWLSSDSIKTYHRCLDGLLGLITLHQEFPSQLWQSFNLTFDCESEIKLLVIGDYLCFRHTFFVETVDYLNPSIQVTPQLHQILRYLLDIFEEPIDRGQPALVHE